MKKLFLLILILVPLSTFAADAYTLLEPLPCIENTGQTCENGLIKQIDTRTYLSYVYKFSIAFAAVAAVVLIMYAGFEYATTDIIGNKAEAKKRIQNALMGLVTLLCSYLILQTIDPRLVEIDTQLKPIGLSGQTFNYNDLVMTANDYRIREELKKANDDASVYEKEAAALREQSNAEQDEEKSIELRERALGFERKATQIRSLAAAKAIYDTSAELTKSLPEVGPNSGGPTKEQKLEIEQKRNAIAGSIDENIKRAKNLGDIESAVELEKKKEYYLAKFEQDQYLVPQENKALRIAKVSSGETRKKEIEKIITQIQSYNVPDTISNETRDQIAADKNTVVDRLNKLIEQNP